MVPPAGDDYLSQLGFAGETVAGAALKLVLEMGAFHLLAIYILVAKKPKFVKCTEPDVSVEMSPIRRPGGP